MRTLAAQYLDDITDATTSGLMGALSAPMLEKDYHITDVLQAIANIRTSVEATLRDPRSRQWKTFPPALSLDAHLVFAGGTCLSKAHGLIERMSEDIDLKVVLDPMPEGYRVAVGGGSRTRLKQLHQAVEDALSALGYRFTVSDGENPDIQDSRRYYHLSLDYSATFPDVSGVLRPQLKVELIHREPLRPATSQRVTYLLERRLGVEPSIDVTLMCISVEETLAEKVLSLLRRCAWKWSGSQHGPFDTALVRHIYDVWRIAETQPDTIQGAESIFADIVRIDMQEFGNQNQEFVDDPGGVLRDALARVETDAELMDNFNNRLVPLLTADTVPSYQECLSVFVPTARRLLARL